MLHIKWPLQLRKRVQLILIIHFHYLLLLFQLLQLLLEGQVHIFIVSRPETVDLLSLFDHFVSLVDRIGVRRLFPAAPLLRDRSMALRPSLRSSWLPLVLNSRWFASHVFLALLLLLVFLFQPGLLQISHIIFDLIIQLPVQHRFLHFIILFPLNRIYPALLQLFEPVIFNSLFSILLSFRPRE